MRSWEQCLSYTFLSLSDFRAFISHLLYLLWLYTSSKSIIFPLILLFLVTWQIIFPPFLCFYLFSHLADLIPYYYSLLQFFIYYSLLLFFFSFQPRGRSNSLLLSLIIIPFFFFLPFQPLGRSHSLLLLYLLFLPYYYFFLFLATRHTLFLWIPSRFIAFTSSVRCFHAVVQFFD